MFLAQTWATMLCLVSALAIQAPPPPPPDAFAPIRALAGSWRTTSHGQPGDGFGERTYQIELGGVVLSSRSRAVYPPQAKNPKGETHQDIGLFTFDRARKKLVLRQFHSEGFVNQYVGGLAPDGRTFVFETEAIENIPAGWRARETYRFIGPDEVVEVFELAEPDKGFELYSETTLRRIK